LNVQEQIKKYIASQPEPKRSDMRELHRLTLQVSPECKLWFFDGKDSKNHTVSNPTIGYGFHTIKYANVGKGFAVLQSGKVRISGFVAWLAWAAAHLQFLATSSLRLSVFLQWVWTYVTGQRGDRLIVSQHGSEVTKPGLDPTAKATFAGRQHSAPEGTEGVKTRTGDAIALREAI
jgi:hypothetical protein